MDQANIPTHPSRFCRHCWAWLPDTANFCGLCGRLSQVMGDSPNIPTEKSSYPSIDYMTVPHNTKGTELSENQYKPANLMPMQPLLSNTNESTISDSDENSSILIPLPSPLLSSEDLPTLSAEGQSYLHGLHQQPGFEHGLHQQPGFEHGLHQYTTVYRDIYRSYNIWDRSSKCMGRCNTNSESQSGMYHCRFAGFERGPDTRAGQVCYAQHNASEWQ